MIAVASGIANIGNTCCFSALLQALSHAPGFVRFVLQTPHALVQVGRSSAVYASVRHLLACSWAQASLIGKHQQQQHVRAVSPADVVGTLRPFMSKHGIGAQNEQLDAHELYCILADTLCRGCPIRPRMKAMLMGSMQCCLRCEACDTTSTTVTPFSTIDLDITGNSGNGIVSLLNAYLAPERITDWTCGRCGCKRTAALINRIHNLPDVLVICIKRATTSDSSVCRYGIEVDQLLPVELMAPLTTPRSQAEARLAGQGPYHLSSVICHYGSQYGGHYTSVVRHPSALDSSCSSCWCAYDDDSVTIVGKMPRSVESSCYMLMYSQSATFRPNRG